MRFTTAALAAKLEVSEAALYRHFASKAQMFEGLIDFIETSVFSLLNQIADGPHDQLDKARRMKADLFVSVHADSVRDPQVSGSSVYVLSEKGATDEQARWLADRENAADLVGGVSLDDKDPVLASVLVDLINEGASGRTGDCIQLWAGHPTVLPPPMLDGILCAADLARG